jgi:outer membrane protein OmpA-like peptidoglycan-associated protein
MRTFTLTALIAGASFISLAGCSHKSIRPEEPLASSVFPKTVHLPDLELAHFAFNSAVLTESGKVAISQDARALQQDPNLKVEAQGYCDDRGSVQYNQALGERRALAVKAYLVSLGISADRVATASFGKSHPLDPRDTEQAWALNRRASFVILNGGNSVALR